MPPRLLAIAGGSGSGKTALARRTADLAADGATIVEVDWFYRDLATLPEPERAERNFDHPEALEWELLLDALERLQRGEAARVPVYDFSTHTRAGEREIAPAVAVVVEGLHALHRPELRALADVAAFVDTSEAERMRRRLARDVAERGRTPESVSSQFDRTVRPMHAAFVETVRAHAHLIVDGEADFEQPARELLRRAGLRVR